MSNIYDLARHRAIAMMHVRNLGMSNTPTDPVERVAADARYRLACDAYDRAEREYQAALAKLSTAELIALSTAEVEP